MSNAPTPDRSAVAVGATPERSAGGGTPTDDGGIRVRAALLSIVVGIALFGVKYAAYAWTGSAAILSDALESSINVIAAVFAFAGLRFASRPADRGHPYGHGKMEYFSAVFEGGLIAFAALVIIGYAVRDLIRGPEVADVELGLLLTLAAGVVNAALGWFLLRIGRRYRSIALVADGQHVLSDFQTSVGVVVGLILVRLTGFAWFDPLAALVVGVSLSVTGYRLVREAAGGLLDEEDPELLKRVVAAFEAVRFPGIIRIHRLRAIRSGSEAHADAHLIVPEFWTVVQAHDAVFEFERRALATCGIGGDITFHVDPCLRALCAVCDLDACPVRERPFQERPCLEVAEAVAFVPQLECALQPPVATDAERPA